MNRRSTCRYSPTTEKTSWIAFVARSHVLRGKRVDDVLVHEGGIAMRERVPAQRIVRFPLSAYGMHACKLSRHAVRVKERHGPGVRADANVATVKEL